MSGPVDAGENKTISDRLHRLSPFISGGYLQMGKTALSIGADTFSFSRNPRGGKAKEIDLG